MKKRIALILAVIATVSTLGSNAVMARYDAVCTHIYQRTFHVGTFVTYKDSSDHYVHNQYEKRCIDCDLLFRRYDEVAYIEGHSPILYETKRVDDPDREGYYWYETTWYCTVCCGYYTKIT